jgi:hypothetical protein
MKKIKMLATSFLIMLDMSESIEEAWIQCLRYKWRKPNVEREEFDRYKKFTL